MSIPFENLFSFLVSFFGVLFVAIFILKSLLVAFDLLKAEL